MQKVVWEPFIDKFMPTYFFPASYSKTAGFEVMIKGDKVYLQFVDPDSTKKHLIHSTSLLTFASGEQGFEYGIDYHDCGCCFSNKRFFFSMAIQFTYLIIKD